MPLIKAFDERFGSEGFRIESWGDLAAFAVSSLVGLVGRCAIASAVFWGTARLLF